MSRQNSPSLVQQDENNVEIAMENINENKQVKIENTGTNNVWLSKKNSPKKAEPKVSTRSKTLWKLVRMKYIPRLEFRLCRICSNVLFHSKSRFIEKEDGGVKIMFELCKDCVELNMHIKDVLCEWVIKKKAGENNTK